MSHTTSTVIAPVLAVVKTHGKLHGSQIATDARSARDIADEIARNPRSKSAQSLVAEEVLRATQRVSRRKGFSKLERVADELAKRGLDDLADELFIQLGQALTTS